MLTFMKKAAVVAALLGAFSSAAFALSTDPNKIIPSRMCEAGQIVCSVRATVNFNDPNINSGVWFATLPKNAYILAIDADVTTVFSTGTLTMGVTKTGADFLAGSGGTSGTTFAPITSAALYHLTTAAGLGVAVTGVAANQTASGSGVPVYVRQVTAATTGVVTIIITFAKDNDQ